MSINDPFFVMCVLKIDVKILLSLNHIGCNLCFQLTQKSVKISTVLLHDIIIYLHKAHIFKI